MAASERGFAPEAEKQQARKHSPHDGLATSSKMIDERRQRRYGKVHEDNVFRGFHALKTGAYSPFAIREYKRLQTS